MDSTERAVGLDVLRVLLALLVFAFHAHSQLCCKFGVFTDFISVGAIAMTMFFMLSGYCLWLGYGSKTFSDKKVLKLFYVKRLISILPIYYIVSLAHILLLGKESIVENVLLFPIEALCFQSAFTSLFTFSHNGATWFISCLMMCYFVFPLFQLIINSVSQKGKYIIFGVLVLLSLWSTLVRSHFSTVWLYENPIFRILEFSIGMLLADYNIRHKTSSSTGNNNLRYIAISAIVCVCLISGVSYAQQKYDIKDFMLCNWLIIPCSVLLFVCLGRVKCSDQSIISKCFCYLGKVSYPFYLVQFFVWPITIYISECLDINGGGKFILSVVICCILSMLTYELIQKRANNLFNRLLHPRMNSIE